VKAGNLFVHFEGAGNLLVCFVKAGNLFVHLVKAGNLFVHFEGAGSLTEQSLPGSRFEIGRLAGNSAEMQGTTWEMHFQQMNLSVDLFEAVVENLVEAR